MSELMLNITEKQCPVAELLKYIKGHPCMSCGKCVFGYEGASQLIMMLEDITAKRGRNTDMDQMRMLASFMSDQSLCEDGEKLGRALLEYLDCYADEFMLHISQKGCTAAVCKKFVTYHILQDKCIGCGDCMDACEDEAILGKRRFVHVIDQKACSQCGECLDSCSEGAIVMAGAEKPRCPARPVPVRK